MSDLIERVARAIEDQLTTDDGWCVGTPALRNMCLDFAQAAIAAIDLPGQRAALVAEIVAWLRDEANGWMCADMASSEIEAKWGKK